MLTPKQMREKEVSFLRRIKREIDEGSCENISKQDGDSLIKLLIKDAIRNRIEIKNADT